MSLNRVLVIAVLLGASVLTSGCSPKRENGGGPGGSAGAKVSVSTGATTVWGTTVAVGGTIIVDRSGGETIELPITGAEFTKEGKPIFPTDLKSGVLVGLTVENGVVTRVEELSEQEANQAGGRFAAIGKLVGYGPAVVIATEDGPVVTYPFAPDALLVKNGKAFDGLQLRGNMNVVITLEEGRIVKLEDLDP